MNNRGTAVMRMLLAVYAIVVAVLLSVTAISIYQEGTAPENVLGDGVYVHPVYSAELVEERFKSIAGPIYGFFGLALAVLVLDQFQKRSEAKPRIQTLPLVKMLEQRMDANKQDTPEAKSVHAERRYRNGLYVLLHAVYLICIVAASLWLLKPSSFASKELEEVMGQFALHVFPWIGLGLLASMVVAELNQRSALRELPSLRKVLTRKTIQATAPASNRTKLFLRIAIYVSAVGLIVWGITNGGMRDVLFKAINICTECIGLG